jgi:hypothetical protein
MRFYLEKPPAVLAPGNRPRKHNRVADCLWLMATGRIAIKR